MQKIGVFDSGIGGFSILREILARVPGVEIDYISDDVFAPYGTKSDSEIIQRSELVSGMLLKRGAVLVVVACNSATAAAISTLRQNHPDTIFVGVEPYINVLNHEALYPGIKKAAVITTVLTGRSEKFRLLKQRLDPEGKIRHLPMPNLATIVENILHYGYNEDQKRRLEEELKPLKELSISHLILGCTHYPLIADLIEEYLGVKTVSAAPYVANRVKDLLPPSAGQPATAFCFLSTASPEWQERSVEELDELLKFSGIGA